MKKATRRIVSVLYVSAALSMFSCKHDVNPEDYMNTLSKTEGLQKTVKLGQIEYHFKLATPEEMALKGSYDFANHQLDTNAYLKRLSDMIGSLFIIMEQVVDGSKNSVLKYNVAERAEYEQRVMYYQFYAKNDFQLDCGGRTTKPTGYIYENQMEASPINKAVIVFTDDSTCQNFTVTFDDQALGNRFIKASFNRKDLEALPRLSIK